MPPGATGIQLCRYFRRGTKVVVAPNRFVTAPSAIASLTSAFNRLPPRRVASGPCDNPKRGWIDAYFVYPHSSTQIEVLLGGCGIALGPKHAESSTNPGLVTRLVSLTSS